MALLAQYHSRYHAKVIDSWPGNNEYYVNFTAAATTILTVEPYVHGIANDLLPARLKQPGLHNSRGGSAARTL